MTTRRTLLQGTASLIAPAEIEFGGALDVTVSDSPFSILIGEYRRMVAQLDGIFAARNRAEANASFRNIHFNDCPELAAVEQNERAWFAAEKKLIQLGARARAGSIEEVAQKLILWRLTDHDPRGFDNPFDILAFAAYRDLLLLAGKESLTKDADEKALAIVWDDEAFNYSPDEDDFDDDEAFNGGGEEE